MNPTDQDLLELFRTSNDQAAFEQLVQRHGPMVMGICRRILGSEQDAWDAFQSVFLLLVRRAESLQKHPAISGWLYQTAIYTSKAARSSLLRHSSRFQPLEEDIMQDTTTPDSGEEWGISLDEEIQRLPDKYRFPVILCHVEKRTYEEAAEELKLSYGTLRRRLSDAKDLLRSRLVRRGIGMTSAAMGMLLARNALAQMPENTALTTAKMASSFAAGALDAGGVAAAEAGLVKSGAVSTKAMAIMKVGLKVIWIEQLKTAVLVGLGSLGAVAALVAVAWHVVAKAPMLPSQKKAGEAPGVTFKSMPMELPAQSQGQILFQESFEDSGLASRGWYDLVAPVFSSQEHIPGSGQSLEFRFLKERAAAMGGNAIRHKFFATDAVDVDYWMKHSSGWTSSATAAHVMLMTNKNHDLDGAGRTRLTVTIGETEGRPAIFIQDGQNLDELRLNENLSPITESRAVAGGNGDSDGYGEGLFYPMGEASTHYTNRKILEGTEVCFGDEPGRFYKGDWHHVKVHIRLNSISDGKTVADGKLKCWLDGRLVMDYPDVIFRTALNGDMKFNQFLVAPHIVDGSLAEQAFWLDDLTLSSAQAPDLTNP